MSTFVKNNFTIILAATGLVASFSFLSVQINLDKDLLWKFGLSASGALLAVVYSYFVGRALQRIKEKTKPRVFISYSHEDAEFAMKLVDDLTKIGVKPVIDRLELKVGDDIKAGIDRLIESCPYVITILSRNSKSSEWTNKEALQALKRDKRVLPVVLDLESIPEELSGIYYANFSVDYGAGFSEIEKSIKKRA